MSANVHKKKDFPTVFNKKADRISKNILLTSKKQLLLQTENLFMLDVWLAKKRKQNF